MTAPLVSIVINNYNYARFLRQAIDSALAQSYGRTEVVVVDDGSTDSSRDIIAGYGDRITPVLKPNGGQASAFNAGFAASRGDIVIFLDADDMLFPGTAERVVRAWRAGISKVQYRLQVVDGEGRPQQTFVPPLRHPMPSGNLRPVILARGDYLSPPTTGNAFDRRVLERILPMPEERFRLSADAYHRFVDPFHGEVVSLQEVLGFYRLHGSNTWWIRDVDVGKLKQAVLHGLKKQELIREIAAEQGVDVPPDLALRKPTYVKFRMALRILRPEEHPIPGESVWRLAVEGVRAQMSSPYAGLARRVALAAWFLCVALVPRRLARQLVRWALAPGTRPRLLHARRAGAAAAPAEPGAA